MTKVQRSAECKNSPKNAFAEEVAVQLLTQGTDVVANIVTDDAVLGGDSEEAIEGREQILALIGRGLEPDLETLEIHHAITHGKVGAVNGTMGLGDGSRRGFCFVLEFASTKADRVKRVQVYRN
jgi:hypothetical protein